jgi:hypothetical protein
MDELFASGIKLAYPPEYNFLFQSIDETEASNLQSRRVNCPSLKVCFEWALNHKNVSILWYDLDIEIRFAYGDFIGENSEPLLCKLEDGVVYNTGLTMGMFYGDPLMRRVSEIIERVVEAGIYNYWISKEFHSIKLYEERISTVNRFDEYYSFKLYHMQPAFYLLLIGCSISALCFMFEILYNRVLSKTKCSR